MTPLSRSFSRFVQSNCIRASQSSSPPLRHASTARRCMHTTRPLASSYRPSRAQDHLSGGNEQRKTDLGSFDLLRNTTAPATAIDACTNEGFAFDNHMKVSGCGVILVGGEVFRWRPWLHDEGAVGANDDRPMKGRLLNNKGRFEVKDSAWGVLDLLYPKPGV